MTSLYSSFSKSSIFSAGCIQSASSTGSILSICSVGSIFSFSSAGSILSIRSQRKILCVDDKPLGPLPSGQRIAVGLVTAAAVLVSAAPAVIRMVTQ
ncbi:MAG: hypothetical protein ACKVIQ_10550 [Acidimicrobiales bacterium]